MSIQVAQGLKNNKSEKKINNITDYNDPEFTGGMSYEFNPYRHFKCQKV
jgi:hypothetical protein